MQAEMIETNEALDKLVRRLSRYPLIAVDTEFQRETSYYPKLALVQVATQDLVACIDPLAFDAQAGIAAFMLDDAITKVFHSCSQDMEVLYYYLGKPAASIEDTQIAYALLNEHLQASYAAMIADLLDVTLDKSQTRTDWLRRPLTRKQLEYAADDVSYLFQCYPILMQQLKDAGRMAWYQQDCSKLITDYSNSEAENPELWKRVKGTSRLSRKQLAVVQAIAAWRESLAQKKDLTRRRVLDDDTVITLAIEQPATADQLGMLISGGRRTISLDHRELDALLDSINRASSLPKNQWPDNRFSLLDNEQKQLLKKLQQLTAEAAKKQGISPSVLYSRKQLEQMISNAAHKHTVDEQDWRYQLIGKQLEQAVENNGCND
jgi:ribonuclease D